MDDKQYAFLIDAYKTSLTYFSDYSNRVSTRFNILLGINSALAAFYGNAWLNAQSSPNNGLLPISIFGLIISFLLYIQSAQDKYVLKHQIMRINEIRKKIEENIKRHDIPALFSPLDDTDIGKKGFVFESITSWRSNAISLTRIHPMTSLVFIVFWALTFFVRF
jgi:hypothetical protein